MEPVDGAVVIVRQPLTERGFPKCNLLLTKVRLNDGLSVRVMVYGTQSPVVGAVSDQVCLFVCRLLVLDVVGHAVRLGRESRARRT